jgi:hypothetical protein
MGVDLVQVMGHTKTICVLIGGVLIFHEMVTLRKVTGMSFAVLGMVGYGVFTHLEKQAAVPEKSSMPSPDKGKETRNGEGETALLIQPPSRADSSAVEGSDTGEQPLFHSSRCELLKCSAGVNGSYHTITMRVMRRKTPYSVLMCHSCVTTSIHCTCNV